ncbi:MAG: hypothetical protein M0C28_25575 [Candidatus Moduliflexus flocculans]|nr:hypothetical protein [Candidatus Moduliflexus flocculans]
MPLGVTIDVPSTRTLPLLPATCMLSDIASVKTGFAEFYRQAGRPFVSTHPMFGPTHANVRSTCAAENAVIISESVRGGQGLLPGPLPRPGAPRLRGQLRRPRPDRGLLPGHPLRLHPGLRGLHEVDLDAPGTNFRKHREIATSLLGEDDRPAGGDPVQPPYGAADRAHQFPAGLPEPHHHGPGLRGDAEVPGPAPVQPGPAGGTGS